MAKDPKKKFTEDRRRFLTIHDGAFLTPAVVAVLDVLARESEEILAVALDHEPNGREARVKASGYAREKATPILVARSDGIAVYVSNDWVIA
jgi:hypothetical protein